MTSGGFTVLDSNSILENNEKASFIDLEDAFLVGNEFNGSTIKIHISKCIPLLTNLVYAASLNW